MSNKRERNRQTYKEREVTVVRIAVYMRLSKTDEKVREESNSISMQRILIKKFIHLIKMALLARHLNKMIT